jgi:hypothetical protein
MHIRRHSVSRINQGRDVLAVQTEKDDEEKAEKQPEQYHSNILSLKKIAGNKKIDYRIAKDHVQWKGRNLYKQIGKKGFCEGIVFYPGQGRKYGIVKD